MVPGGASVPSKTADYSTTNPGPIGEDSHFASHREPPPNGKFRIGASESAGLLQPLFFGPESYRFIAASGLAPSWFFRCFAARNDVFRWGSLKGFARNRLKN